MDCVESAGLNGEDCGYHQGDDDGQDLWVGHHVNTNWVYEVVSVGKKSWAD